MGPLPERPERQTRVEQLTDEHDSRSPPTGRTAMTADLRVLICSSSAAVTAGIESVLRGTAADGHRLTTSHTHRHGDLVLRAGVLEPHVAVLHGLDLQQTMPWGRWRRTAVVLAVEGTCCGSEILRAVRAGVVCLVAIDTDL